MVNTVQDEKVTDDILVALIEQEKAAVITEGLGVIEAQRAAANLAYAGVYTNDLAPSSGMSSILINVVQPVTDTLHTYLSNIMCSDKETVVFSPTANKMHPIMFPNGQQVPVSSTKVAEQATALVNHAIHKMNPGFDIISTGIKSSLLNKNAYWKTTWEEMEEVSTKMLKDMSPEEVIAHLASLEEQGYECEIIEEEIVETEVNQNTPELSLSAIDYTGSMYKIMCKYMKAMPRIECIPPEEFLVNDEAITLSKDDELTRFMAHRHLMTIGDIKKRWPHFNLEDLGEAGPSDDLEYNYEKLYRNSFDGTYDTVPNRYDQTGANRLIELTESWIRADRNGDGYAEWIHSFSVGNNLLASEEWPGELPFSTYTNWTVPHKLVGLGVYDKAQGYHRAKTGLVRQMIDHGTLANTPRFFGNPEYVNERDFQRIRPGLIKTRRGFQQSDILPVPVTPGSAHTMNMLQYLDKEIIAQFGIDVVSGAISQDVEKSGNDAEKTQMVIDNSSSKIQALARNLAEGFKGVIWTTYTLLLENADHPSVMEMVDTVTPGVPFLAAQVDMKDYLKKDDLMAKVGLGHLTSQEKLRNLSVIQNQVTLLQQSGIPVPPNKLLNLSSEMIKAAGFVNVQDFLPTAQEVQQAQQQAQQQQAPMQQLQQRGMEAEVMNKELDTQKKKTEADENMMQTETGYQEQERKNFSTEVDAEVTYFNMQQQAQGKPVTNINTKIG